MSSSEPRVRELPPAPVAGLPGDEAVVAQVVAEETTAFSNAGAWIATLYMAEAVPYMLVMSVAVVFYKDLGLSVGEVAAYTSLFGLTWMFKPLWSPLVEIISSERTWVLALQGLMALALVGLAIALRLDGFLIPTLVCLWVVAFCSATHDMAADGYYMRALVPSQQAVFVGIRSAFYRLGNVATQGGLVILAGMLIERGYDNASAWSLSMLAAAMAMLLLALFHSINMPRVQKVRSSSAQGGAGQQVVDMLRTFFEKPDAIVGVAYLLLYRFPEAQLTKVAQPFLLDGRDVGGLGLSVKQVGTVYGTIGALCLIVGGILGGFTIARFGLRRCLLPMAFAIHLPNLAYVWLSMEMPSDWRLIATAVGIEQFGYGVGFASYMVFMLYFSRGPFQTAHFALCTGLMAAGMFFPGFFSGYVQEWLGYANFFIWVMIAAIPSFIVTMLVRVEGDFGRTGAAAN